MTADYAYLFIQFVARKNQSGEITPKEYTYAVSSAQNSIYDFFIGRLEEYQFMKPVPRVALGQSQKIDGLLRPLKVSNSPLNVVAGLVTYPTDFDYLALMTDVNGKNIPGIDDSKKPARLNSKIDPPTTSNPFHVRGATGWEIYPATGIAQVKVSYYKRPVDTVWNYTVNSNGRPVYNPVGSVHPVFNDVVMQKVLARALRILGFSFTLEDWKQFGEETIKQGE